MTKRDEDRARRLAEALRANLRRRKAQARGDQPASERCAGVAEPSEDVPLQD